MWTIRPPDVRFDKINKILVVHLRPLGDVLLTSGYLGALRRKFPGAQIDYLVYKPYDRLLFKNPYLSNVIAVEKGAGRAYLLNRLKMFTMIRRRHYDLIIDSNNSTTSAQIVALSGARYRLGNDQGKGRLFYNLRAPDGPERYNAAKRFDTLKPLGIDQQPFELFFYVSDEAQTFIDEWLGAQGLGGTPIALFSPGSSYAQKAWSGAQFGRLADLVSRHTDLTPVILWGPREGVYVEEMRAAMKRQAHVLPPTDIDQCGAALKRAAFLFCNDGGVNHLAVATQTPTLAIFGIINPSAWSPQGYVPTHFHLINPAFDWRVNFTRDYGLTAEDAFEKFRQIAPNFNIKFYE